MIRYLAGSIPYLGEQLSPLNELLKKKTRWNWTPSIEEQFHHLLQLVSSAASINSPHSEWPYNIQVDASDEGVGEYLYQICPDGKRHIILFFFKMKGSLSGLLLPRNVMQSYMVYPDVNLMCWGSILLYILITVL